MNHELVNLQQAARNSGIHTAASTPGLRSQHYGGGHSCALMDGRDIAGSHAGITCWKPIFLGVGKNYSQGFLTEDIPLQYDLGPAFGS